MHPQCVLHQLFMMCDSCSFCFSLEKVSILLISVRRVRHCFATRSKNVSLLLLCDVRLASSQIVGVIDGCVM